MLTGAFLCLPYGGHARGRQPQAPAAILLNSRFTANRFYPIWEFPYRNEFSSLVDPSKTQPGSKRPQQQ